MQLHREEDDSLTVKLADFGCAIPLHETPEDRVSGCIPYLSPERLADGTPTREGNENNNATQRNATQHYTTQHYTTLHNTTQPNTKNTTYCKLQNATNKIEKEN